MYHKVMLTTLLIENDLTVSVSDGRRIVALGKVSINGKVEDDFTKIVEVKTGDVLTAGKKSVVLQFD